MSDSESEPLEAFVEKIVEKLQKNGFPGKRVAFPLVQMYEAADEKGLSFNAALDRLAERGITHEKTPEKVIFAPAVADPSGPEAGGFPGIDPSMLAGMSQEELLQAAQKAMQAMGPEKLAALRTLLESMTPEEQAAMMEQARKLGLA